MAKYTKDFLIKELAARADFTLGDVRIIWDTFEELVQEIILSGDELMVGGLFKIYAKAIAPHEYYDIKTKTYTEKKTTYRLVIKPSVTLRAILKNKNLENPPEVEE